MPQILRQQANLNRVFEDQESFGTTLFMVAADRYGAEMLSWHPLTIRKEIEDDFDTKLSKSNFDKLMGVVVYLQSDDFFNRPSTFIQICNAVAGGGFNPFIFDPADAKECAWAMTELLLLNPPDNPEPFSDDVRRYIGITLDWEGITEAPDILNVAIRDTTTGKPDYSGFDVDNPGMFQAEYELQKSRSQEVSTMLRANLTELLEQLSGLRLENGNTDDMVNKARKALRI